MLGVRIRGRDGSHGSLAKAAARKYQLKITAVAVVISVFCGAAYALLFYNDDYHPDFYSYVNIPEPKELFTKCHTDEYLNEAKKVLLKCQSEIFDVRYDFFKLELDHEYCQKVARTTRDEVKLLTAQQPLGPFGTVRGSRTNLNVPGVESINPKLADILRTVAVNRELIVAIANSNVTELLQVWFTAIKELMIPNYLVVALDNSTASFCRKNNVPVYERESDAVELELLREPVGSNGIPSLKYRILREFLQIGYSVLLSDVDVVFLRNPFEQDYLHRDVDIEAMTDGHDNATAYGYDEVADEPEMGYGRYSHSIRIFFYNTGFFYARPTVPSLELMDRVHTRLLLKDKDEWDQLIFNRELFLPSSPGYEGLHASKRTMDFYMFLNSKTLFLTVRHNDTMMGIRPVAVHVNYHSDKLQRMKAVLAYYERHNRALLDRLPYGSD